MRNNYIITSLILLLLFMTGCSSENNLTEASDNVDLTISAAASLKDAMEEIEDVYEEANPHVDLNINFGGSGSLQQQIVQGAPVDLFFSAAEDDFQMLVDDGLISEKDTTPLLSNEIVLIVPAKNSYNILSFEDLSNNDIDHISIGIPETVPAGQYAKETLGNLGLWQVVEAKIVYAKDVRQVLSYVETGNVAAGIVYKTDALISDKVKVIATADTASHSPINYPVGIIKETRNYEAAKDFYNYLQSDAALGVFAKYGFITK